MSDSMGGTGNDDGPQVGIVATRRTELPIVGIGGSAGALPALREFFKAMPASAGMAFVVVVHL